MKVSTIFPINFVHVDISKTPYPPNVENSGHLTTPLPPSSCPRGYWMYPYRKFWLNLQIRFATEFLFKSHFDWKINFYLYISAIEKCLRVVHSEETEKTLTIGDAMLQCSIGNGRLLPLSTCEEIPKLLLALYHEFGKIDQKYYMGLFAFNDGEGVHYRNWENKKIVDS